MKQFDYDSKTWGGGKVRLSPSYLGALRLKYALEDLKETRGRILEVGCGAGGMAKAVKFYRPDLEVLGIDISQKAIEEAKQKPEKVNFLKGNAYQLPFKDKSFDAVLIFDLLEHLENPLKSLNEIYRVLKPGGIFSGFVPIEGEVFSLSGISERIFGFPKKENYAGHIQRFTLKSLLKLLKQSRLKFLKKRYFGHLFFQLVDLTYFVFLSCRGKNVAYSVEGYLAREKGLKRNFVALMKSIIAVVSYGESKIFWFLPALGVHLTARRSP